jgi:hypothetical protein
MAAVTIQSVKARQIFDSRGNPTVEVRMEINPIELVVGNCLIITVCSALPQISYCLSWIRFVPLSPSLTTVSVGDQSEFWCARCAGGYRPQRRELREGRGAERRFHWYVLFLAPRAVPSYHRDLLSSALQMEIVSLPIN